MRKILPASVLALMALAGVALAQSGTAPAPVAANTPAPAAAPADDTPANPPVLPPGSALVFDKMWHVWGKIPDTAPVTKVFTFTNKSADKTVTITQVHSSCGCTTPSLTKKTYAPGETGEITVTFNPAGRRGLERKITTLTTDDPAAPKIELLTISNVQPKVFAEPASVFMGEILKTYTTPPDQTLYITGRDPGFEVTSFESSDPKFFIAQANKETLEIDGDKVTRYTYKVTVPVGLETGYYSSRLSFKTNDPNMPELPIAASAQIVGKITVMPEKLMVRAGSQGESFSSEVYLASRGGVNFDILSVSTELPADVRVVSDVMPVSSGVKNYYRLRIAGTCTGGLLVGQVKLRTTLPEAEELLVPVAPMSAASPAPNIRPMPAVLRNAIPLPAEAPKKGG